MPVTEDQVRRERFKPMIGYFLDFVLLSIFVYIGVLNISKSSSIEYLIFVISAYVFG